VPATATLAVQLADASVAIAAVNEDAEPDTSSPIAWGFTRRKSADAVARVAVALDGVVVRIDAARGPRARARREAELLHLNRYERLAA
jgi:hypothetical protein